MPYASMELLKPEDVIEFGIENIRAPNEKDIKYMCLYCVYGTVKPCGIYNDGAGDHIITMSADKGTSGYCTRYPPVPFMSVSGIISVRPKVRPSIDSCGEFVPMTNEMLAGAFAIAFEGVIGAEPAFDSADKETEKDIETDNMYN